MKLNIESIKKLRKEVEELLLEVPDGKRITLDKDLLDALIFFRLKPINGEPDIKIPVWTGEFLRKLDLSQLSFENVWFSTTEIINVSKFVNYKTLTNENEIIGDLVRNHYFPPFVRTGVIDFSNTNVKIDFSNIYGKNINNTKFDNVDLSKSKGVVLNRICNCSFRNTGIKINFNNPLLRIIDSDFSDNDFSNINIGLNFFYDIGLYDYESYRTGKTDMHDILSHVENSSFENTGLNLDCEDFSEFFAKLEEENYKRWKQDNKNTTNVTEYNIIERRNRQLKKDFRMKFISTISRYAVEIGKGHFNGCYLNGRKIMTPEERKENKTRMLIKYRDYEAGMFDNVRNSFREQISKM